MSESLQKIILYPELINNPQHVRLTNIRMTRYGAILRFANDPRLVWPMIPGAKLQRVGSKKEGRPPIFFFYFRNHFNIAELLEMFRELPVYDKLTCSYNFTIYKISNDRDYASRSGNIRCKPAQIHTRNNVEILFDKVPHAYFDRFEDLAPQWSFKRPKDTPPVVEFTWQKPVELPMFYDDLVIRVSTGENYSDRPSLIHVELWFRETQESEWLMGLGTVYSYGDARKISIFARWLYSCMTKKFFFPGSTVPEPQKTLTFEICDIGTYLMNIRIGRRINTFIERTKQQMTTREARTCLRLGPQEFSRQTYDWMHNGDYFEEGKMRSMKMKSNPTYSDIGFEERAFVKKQFAIREKVGLWQKTVSSNS